MINFFKTEEFIVIVLWDGNRIAAMSEPTTEKVERAMKEYSCYDNVRVDGDHTFNAEHLTIDIPLIITDDGEECEGEVTLESVLRY